MIERNLATHLAQLARWYPVVTLTGPRQSGKTTLCKSLFPDKAYRNFGQGDVREFARRDPRGFIDDVADGAVLDEVQHAPELLGYLQVEVDERPAVGRFILTGSQQFGLAGAVSQSLAGRSGMATLLPPSLQELRRFEGAGAADAALQRRLLYGGDTRVDREGVQCLPWHAVGELGTV